MAPFFQQKREHLSQLLLVIWVRNLTSTLVSNPIIDPLF